VTGHEQHKAFRCQLPDRPLIVWADPQRLQQVFSNLVGNAFKYTPPGGRITVAGIPQDRLPRIFDLFQRATTTGSGLGIGLAVVQALVTAHGGTVTVTSRGLGQGATFTVRLPISAAQGR
jgi:two-component system, sensor histidine kinase